ncbi:MAG TPA: hypothetical protein VGB37_00765 [Candidatus Lokiarchaeia archaeon]
MRTFREKKVKKGENIAQENLLFSGSEEIVLTKQRISRFRKKT